MIEIKAREGYYLSEPNKEHFYKAIFGTNLNEEDFIEVPIKEAEEIMQRQKTESQITTIEEIDNIVSTVKIIPNIINTFDLSDNEALQRKDLYPEWHSFISKSLEKGFKIRYDNKLFKVRQSITTVLENQYPSISTAALYEEINETATGTIDTPIPYNNNMELFEGKYYSQNGIIYKCIRSTEQAVYHDLNALVGLYVQQV